MGLLDNTCAVIAAGVTYDCDNPPVPGILADILIVNKSDIDTVATGANGEITAITLASGSKVAYKFQGVVSNNGPSGIPSWELDTSGVSAGFKHNLQIHIMDKSAATNELIGKIARGTYVAVVETPEQTTEPFIVFGLSGSAGHGLVMTEGTREYNNSDTGGVALITLGTPSNLKEKQAPTNWFITDYATTSTAVGTLLVPTA